MKALKKILVVALIATTLLAGCGKKADEKTIKVGATAVPHAMVLNDVVKDILAKDGWTLDVVEFTDYVTPNTSLEEGELDANYFQTYGYLVDQNQSRGLHLVPVQGVHYEPMQIFSKNYTSVANFVAGDAIAIPNDFDNEKRALTVAAAAGLIEYDPSLVAANGSPLDGITSNPLGIQFKEVEAANVPQANNDVAGLIVNGNYALESKLKDKSNSVFVEIPDIAARTNYLVVKGGNEETEKTKALIKAITDPSVKVYIEEHYGSAVVPVF
ncbi:MAG: MetQ/NlpA family ABC transporter substrate-binding protein [Lachnospiraceae bacterium]|nr:MetQ/NlpA family ABC transporter substrate-binding protein [Lachnospiraceae bacterium]